MPIQKELYFGYMKAMFNGMGFICIAIGTVFIFGSAPLLKFIPFLVMAFAMMTYPTSSASNEEEIGLAIMRMIMGILLVIVFSAIALGDVFRFNILLWLSLSAIATAFFVTFPVVKATGSGVGANVLNQLYTTANKMGNAMGDAIKKSSNRSSTLSTAIKFVFVICFFVFLFIFIYNFFGASANFGAAADEEISKVITSFSQLLVVFLGLILGGVCLFVGFKLRTLDSVNPMITGVFGFIGLALGSLALMGNLISFVVFALVVGFGILASMPVDKVRPVIGIPIIMIALATTTIAYPDVMGEAVFGIWWPTIDYNIDSTIGPLMQNMRSPFDTLGSGYDCLINPQKCYMDYQPKTSTDESTRSVEVTRIDFIGTEKIDQFTVDPIMVIATVENRGKEDAEGITVTPKSPVYSQGVEGEMGTSAGTVSITCGNLSGQSSCPIEKLFSGELREFVMYYTINTPPIPGNYISMGADVTYETRMTGQVDVMVMDSEYYQKLSKNNELKRSEQVTEDTGGPVRLGLALMRNEMPVRDNLAGVPVMLYLRNDGPGVVQRVISAEVDISDLEAGKKCTYTPSGTGNYQLKGLDKLMEYVVEDRFKINSGDDIGATCISIVPDISVEQRTFAITGDVTYVYNHSSERSMMVEFIGETTEGT